VGVSDKTRAPRGPDQAKRWLAFLRNHREAIAAMDFFTVPTITFGVLYCFFIISHDRRWILHVNVTKHPTSVWIIQQLREAFPFEASHKYLIFDRAQKFGFEVVAAIEATYVRRTRTRGSLSPKGFALCRSDDGIQAFSTKKGPYLVSADVLANYRRLAVARQQRFVTGSSFR
jgi:hypothetical protein